MRRKNVLLATVFFLLIPTIAFAQHGRAVAPMPVQGPPMMLGTNGTVSGLVTSVSGSLVSLADGLVTIDVRNAKYGYDHGPAVALAPGMLINAIVDNGVAPNAPLQARLVFVTTLSQVTLSGAVTAVDVARSTITLLGRTVDVNFQTKFTPLIIDGHATSLADIKSTQLVTVTAGSSGSTLLASAITVTPMFQPPITLIHGTVKSIGTDTWVITTTTGDVTVKVALHTPMPTPDIKVGDTVDVFAITDDTGAYVAVLIVKSTVTVH